MAKSYNFFGTEITYIGNDTYMANFSGHEFRGNSVNDVREQIIAWERQEQRNNIIERLQKLDMSEGAAEFVVDMVSAHHSTETAALMRIDDYLSEHGM